MNTKQLMAIGAVVAVALWAAPAQAQTGEGAMRPGAQQQISNGSVFQRLGDWFATVGKSPGEKQVIKAERQANRAAEELEDQAKKAAAKAEDEAKRAADKAKDEAKQAEDRLKDENKQLNKDLNELREPGKDFAPAAAGEAPDRVESQPGTQF